MMRELLAVLRDALIDCWDQAFLIVFYSLAWLFLVLLVIPGPPATIALFAISEKIASREHLLDFRDYLAAVRRHFGLGWRWAAVNLPAIILLLVDIRTVRSAFPPWAAAPMEMLFSAALALWLVINWFALAFLFQQKGFSLRQALHNGLIMVFKNPGFCLVLTAVTTFLIAASLAVVIVNLLFGPMLVGLIGTHAVINRLRDFRINQEMGAA